MIKLKELREQKGIMQKDLAKHFGVAKSTYSYWESGKTEPDTKIISAIAEYFGVSIDFLLGKSTSANFFDKFDDILPIEAKSFPMLGEIACGKPIMANEEKELYVTAGAKINADFCLRAKGDSMVNARIEDGDIVFIKKQEIVDNGEIAAIVIENSVTLKRVYYYPEQKKLILQAENPHYPPLAYVDMELDSIHILGKAVAFQSSVK